jgi:hypothetical protein
LQQQLDELVPAEDEAKLDTLDLPDPAVMIAAGPDCCFTGPPTTTVQSTSNTTKTLVKQRGEKLANMQRMTGGSVPCCRVQVGGPVKQQSGPAAIMTAGSGRSSVSSLASSSAGTSSSSCCCNGANANGIPQLQHQQSLNQALAIVANKWDREQRIQDQETTRRLTLLKQRKISAILKVSDMITESYESYSKSISFNFSVEFNIW